MLGLLFSLLKLSIWLAVFGFILRLGFWFYLTIFTGGSGDLRPWGSHNRRSWALITGASDGIGAGLAIELAKHKFSFFLLGRNREKLRLIQDEIEKINPSGKVHIIISEASDASFSNVNSVFKEVEQVLSENPEGLLRLLINNVGIGQGGKRRLDLIPNPATDPSNEDEADIFEEIVAVNCNYPVMLTRRFIKHLGMRAELYSSTKLARGLERVGILNVASCAALAPATPFSSLYASTKAFNRSFSISLAGELTLKRFLHPETTPVVDVACVSPGFVISNMTGMSESFICCTRAAHAQVTLRKFAAKPFGIHSIDFIPHWKHGIMWSFLWLIELVVPWEWAVSCVIMPAILKPLVRARNYKID